MIKRIFVTIYDENGHSELLEPVRGTLTCKDKDVPDKVRRLLDETRPGWFAASVCIIYYNNNGTLSNKPTKHYDL